MTNLKSKLKSQNICTELMIILLLFSKIKKKDGENYFEFREKYSSALKPDLELKSSGVFEADFSENTKSKDSLPSDNDIDLNLKN